MTGGSPFQTFYLLFKSNARDEKKAVLDLDKQIAELAKKGDQRNAAEEKHLKELRKRRSEQLRDLKDQQVAAEDTGRAFVDVAEKATQAITAYAGFTAIKSGMINAQEFNRTLTLQAKLWGQNANEISAWGNAVKAAGGSAEGFFSWYQNTQQQNAARGLGTLPPDRLMRQIHDQVKNMPKPMAQMMLGRWGISDIGMQNLLMGGDSEFEAAMAQAQELAKNTAEAAKSSQEFGKSWDNLTTALNKFWTTVNTQILPALGNLVDGATDVVNVIANNKTGAVAAVGALVAIIAPASLGLGALALGFRSIGSGALAIAAPLAGLIAQLGAIAGIAYAIPRAGAWAGSSIAHWINRQRGKGDANGVLPGRPGYSGGSDLPPVPLPSSGSESPMAYLMRAHGMDSAHAAAVVANMQHESGGDINAVGDGGRARGLFQWHPDRRAKILAGTGINVAGASMERQMDAMVWELKQRGQYEPFMKETSAADAAAYFSQRFEVPAGGVAEAMRRGQTAMKIAASSPFSSSGGGGGANVNIGKIDIHTQATDAKGIAQEVGTELQRQIGSLIANNNDAIGY